MPQHKLAVPLVAGQSALLVHERTPVVELVQTFFEAKTLGRAQICPGVVHSPSPVQANGQALAEVQALPAAPKSQQVWPAPHSWSLAQSSGQALWQTPLPAEKGLPPSPPFFLPWLLQAPTNAIRTTRILWGCCPIVFMVPPRLSCIPVSLAIRALGL